MWGGRRGTSMFAVWRPDVLATAAENAAPAVAASAMARRTSDGTLVDQREHPLGGHRQPGRADADRVLDGAGDGGGDVPDRRLADPARPEGALALAALDDVDEHVGEVLRVRDQ